MRKIHTISNTFLFALMTAAIAACAASPAYTVEYEKRWGGKLGGQSQYFVPQSIAAGDFAPDTGQEILILDTDGYAYFMSWQENALSSFWITSTKITSGRVLGSAAADTDGNNEDELAFIDRDGKLNILGGDRRKFKPVCKDCLPESFSDFKAELVAPANADRDQHTELFFIGKWKNKTTALLIKSSEQGFKVLRATPLDARGEIMSIMPATTPPRNRFYLHVYRGKNGDAIVPLNFDEEGFNIENPIDTSTAKISINAVFAEDTNGDSENELYIFGSSGTGLKTKSVVLRNDPRSGGGFKPMPGIAPGSAFMAAPDLNGDGIPELFTADYTGAAAVYSKAALTLKINNKTRNLSGLTVRRGKPFINPTLLPGVTSKRNGDVLALTRKDRRIVLDMKKNRATMKTSGDEEWQQISIEFFTQGSVVYIDASAASNALGLSASWDMLSYILKIGS